MVVWVEARAEVRTARTTSLSQGEPRTPVASVLRMASSSANFSAVPTPPNATTAAATER
jgi:hypothetical protein